jgi:hypothetical protein
VSWVLVPGLSLFIEKMQFAKILPLPELKIDIISADGKNLDKLAFNHKHQQCAKISAWHQRGTLAQMICVIAFRAILQSNPPILNLIALLATVEVVYTLYQTIQNPPMVNNYFKNGQLNQGIKTFPNIFSPF